MAKPKGQGSTKAPGTALSTRNGARAVLTTPGERYDPPAHVRRHEALQAWEWYWEDNVSSLVTETDKSLLYRWIDCVQRYYELCEQADAEPVIFTNNNGTSANPLYKIVSALGNQIERMEIKLGIGPKNRASLGIQIIQAHEAAQNYHNPSSRPSLTSGDEDDPRLA